MSRFACVLLGMSLVVRSAWAEPKGVGLGVAIGAAHSGTELTVDEIKSKAGSSFAWGFFVDIPLLETFYLTPSAMLYELDLGGEKRALTDVDLNFKFIVPLSSVRLGAGVTAGVTSGLGKYVGHWGGLGFLSLNLVSNIDVFLLAQYKRVLYEVKELEHLQGYLGGMFRF